MGDDQKQLDEYRNSLAELEEALKLDPKNAELLGLKSELVGLITNLETKVKSSSTSAPSPPSSPPAHETTDADLKVGTEVYAQWSSDGVWYEASIAEVKGANAFIVSYSGYGNKEERTREFIRLKGSTDLTTLNNATQKRKPEDATNARNGRDATGKKVKRKKEDKAAANWRAFASTGLTAKTSAPTKKKESIFKSPDSVTGKVGVTGSGKGMTTFAETRQKWDTLKNPSAQAPATDD